MSSFATLRALHAIVGAALDDIERVYADVTSTHTRHSPPFSPSTSFSPSSPSTAPFSPPFSPSSTPFSPSNLPFSPAQKIPFQYPPPVQHSYPSPPSPDPSPVSPRFPPLWTGSDSEPALSDASSRRSSLCSFSSARSSPEPPRDPGAPSSFSPSQVPSTPGRPRPILTDLEARTPSARERAPYESPYAARPRERFDAPCVHPMTPSSPRASFSGLLPPFAGEGPRAALDFPALDEPFYAGAQEGGAEGETRRRAEELTSHPKIICAVNKIVSACGQLSAAVQRPFLTIADAASAYHLPSCMRFLEESHTVEILREAGPGGMHVKDLAARIDDLRHAPVHSCVDPAKLSHILRLLATHHITREVRPDVFANNRVSAAMDSGASCSALRESPEKKYEGTDGVAAFVGLCTDELFKASAYLTDVYLPSVNASGTPPPSPISPTSAPAAVAIPAERAVSATTGQVVPRTPFNMAFRTAVPFFEWLERPGNEHRLRRFGPAMTGTGRWEVPGAVLAGFPWQTLKPGALVVDVGGGIGSTSMLLARAFTHLRFVIQDRPQVVSMGKAAWQARCPEMLESGRAVFVAHDFFLPQPKVPKLEMEEEVGEERRAAVFLLRVITHDWEDEYVTRILVQLRLAAGPETKLLLADYVLPLACVDEDEVDADEDGALRKEGRQNLKERLPGSMRTLAPDGSPLLPNLGKAHANAYWLDMTMRATFNAQERTLRELAALTLTAGWRIVRVTRAEGSVFGHIIAEPVDIPPGALELLDRPLPGAGHAEGEEVDERKAVMGDTFGSQKTLFSEEVLRRGARKKAGAFGARRVGGGSGSSGAKVLRKRRSTIKASLISTRGRTGSSTSTSGRESRASGGGGGALLPAAEIE